MIKNSVPRSISPMHKVGSKSTRELRNCKGQTMGAVDLWLVVSMLIIALVLVMNVGMAMYLKQKLAFVAGQIARDTIDNAHYEKGMTELNEERANGLAKRMMASLGLDPGSTSVNASVVSLGGEDAAKVTLTSTITMFGNIDWLPRTIRVSDTAVSAGTKAMKVMGYLHVHQKTNESFGAGQWGNYGETTNGHYIPIIKPSAITKSIPGDGDQTGISSTSTFEEVQIPVARMRMAPEPDGRPGIVSIGGPEPWNARTGYLQP